MFSYSPTMIPIFGIMAWVAVIWVRAHYGISGRKGRWDPNAENAAVPPMFNKMLEKAMAERDAELQQLRERIEVLERIVTDGHNKKRTLSEEIDNLRDQA